MLPKDRELNIQSSCYRFLRERLSADYYINYSAPGDEKVEKRVAEQVPSEYWKWIDINWLRVGEGIFSISMVQINCNTIIAKDRYGAALGEMVDEVEDELNVDTIDLLDFSNDVFNPVPTGNVLIPRYRGSRSLPEAAGDTVNVEAIDYNVYVWRESVLP
jgi:hypothetical protein